MPDWKIIGLLLLMLATVHCGGGQQTFTGGGNEGEVPGTAVAPEEDPAGDPGAPADPGGDDDQDPGAGDPPPPEDQDSGTSFPSPQ